MNSVDALVTDPPAGISFMGKDWDGDKGGRSGWVRWMTEVMGEAKRVMKPGAHGLVWAIPRTSHWTATALEDAGFEIRDVVTHLFGSGFPKSLNVGKAVKEFEGWGTALKPASEHWVLIRKPCSEKTVAKNVLKWGVGGINVDGCRIEGPKGDGNWTGKQNGAAMFGQGQQGYVGAQPSGRFPANLVLSCICEADQHDAFCPVHLMDEQSGISDARGGNPKQKSNKVTNVALAPSGGPQVVRNDSGGASRFFYVAKPSKRERNAGCEGLPAIKAGVGDERPSGQSMQRLDGRSEREMQNFHPTVKPIKLMRYLIRMITPPGGLVLDPFTGSGTTGCAALKEGFRFLGIEQEQDYISIAKMRCLNAVGEE